LNFLASDVNSNEKYEVVDRTGTPLAIRQSVGIAQEFECTHEFLTLLQFIFITDLHKEAVLSVEVLDPTLDPIYATSQNVAKVTTPSGDYYIPCYEPSKKRDHGKEPGCTIGQISPRCGNGKVDSDEQCDKKYDGACDKTCLCKPGFGILPQHPNECKSLCGDGRVEFPEQCDSTVGCGKNCKCQKGFAPQKNIPMEVNGTITPTNITGCVPVNPCPEKYDPLSTFCIWDKISIDPKIGCACTCLPGFEQWRAGGDAEDDDDSCEDINECEELPFACALGERCMNTVGSYKCTIRKR